MTKVYPLDSDSNFIKALINGANNYSSNTKSNPVEYPNTIEQLYKPDSNSLMQSLLGSIPGTEFKNDLPGFDIGSTRQVDPKLFEDTIK